MATMGTAMAAMRRRAHRHLDYDDGDRPEAVQRHYEVSRALPVSPDGVFAHLDDRTRVAAHRQTPPAMMGGGCMTFAFDAKGSTAVGSRMHMGGSAFGLTLSVDEVVTEREPPRRKLWCTVGAPRLLVIGGCEMGFRIADAPPDCKLTVGIGYRLLRGWFGTLLGRPPGGFCARWRIDRMVADAAKAFLRSTRAPSAA